MQFFLDRDGKTSGPFGPEAVLDMIRNGELAGEDQVWLEGTPEPRTVADLLNGALPEEADERIFEAMAPIHIASPPGERRRFDLIGPFELGLASKLGCLSGCGLFSGVGGGGLLALFCVGLYLWGTFDMNRRGRQEQQLETLRGKIARYVDQHPEAGKPSLEQLQQAGAVTPAERQLIDDLGVQYRPIGSDSPKDSIVFVRPMTSMERRYYKGEPTNFVIWWSSPDDRLTLRNEPKSPSTKTRILTLSERATGKVLFTCETEAGSLYPNWRRDGRVVAIVGHSASGSRPILLSISGEHVEPLSLPEECDPERLLSEEDRKETLRLYSNDIRFEGWKDNLLVLESCISAAFLNAESKPDGSVTARRQFVVAIDDAAKVSVKTSKQQYYQRKEPKAVVQEQVR